LINCVILSNHFQCRCAQINVTNYAAFNKDGEVVRMLSDRKRPLNNRVMGLPGGELGEDFASVNTTTIDMITAGWPRLDLIKIDVEGAESKAYDGAAGALRTYESVVLIMEVNTYRMRDDNAAEAFYRKLASDWPQVCKLVGPRAVRTSPEELLANRAGDDMVVLTRRTDVC
jgi:FkbM family methyltransferase